MNKIIASLLALLLIAAAPASALEWTVLGPRALGMGGAGVADSKGPLASYWNPAALGRDTENSYGVALPVDAHVAFDGAVLDGAKSLNDIHGNNCGAGGCTQQQVNNAYSELSQSGTGVRIDAGAGGDFKIGKLAFFANGFADIGAVPLLDENPAHVNVNSIQQGTNTTELIVKGARILEFGVGYGHELPFAPGLFLGADVKAMNAQVGYSGYNVFINNSGNSNIASTLRDNSTKSSNFGLDAGALWDVNRTFENAWWQPRLGLTGRNLNNPKFDQPASGTAAGLGKFAVNPQARLGASISPFNWWHFASDLDLTRNLTPVDGVASRQLGVGTEIDVFNRSWINIPLRAGLSRNLAEKGAATAVTAGTGLNFLHLIVDVSGMVTPKSVTQDSINGSNQKVPQEIAGSFSLSLLFGGSDSRRGSDNDQQPMVIPPSAPTNAPATPTAPAAPASSSNSLTPAQADQVRAHAAAAQQELNKQSTPSGN